MSDTDFIAYENHRLTIANAELRKERDELEQHIKRLEEAGTNLLWNFCPEYTSESQSDALKQWNKAKEVKP